MILGFSATGLDGTATVTFENAQAVDSTLTPIGSIGFTSSPLTVSFH